MTVYTVYSSTALPNGRLTTDGMLERNGDLARLFGPIICGIRMGLHEFFILGYDPCECIRNEVFCVSGSMVLLIIIIIIIIIIISAS